MQTGNLLELQAKTLLKLPSAGWQDSTSPQHGLLF